MRALTLVAIVALAATCLWSAAPRLVAATPAATATPITALTLIHGIPGKEDELKTHLLSLSEPTLAEKGCLRYRLVPVAHSET